MTEPRDNTERIEADQVLGEHFLALRNFFFYAEEMLNEKARSNYPLTEAEALERVRRYWNKTARIIKGEEEE
jgi:hypothetical protein